ncbi:GNAT family N-acetyltransferase [Asanoa iriomotensis]|nr:GNAT family N-acetyltransferase [Asanoa iriomotensis]
MTTRHSTNRDQATRDGYELDTDPGRIDVDLVFRWLSSDSYWAANRPRAVVVRSIANSVVLGIYKDQAQVAFARVVTDYATFGWLCDVYVDPAERGHGLGTWLAEAARDLLAETGVLRIILATWDAHGVYEKAGFVPVARPDRWMEIDRRNTP